MLDLPGGSHVLDVATGNGVLPLHAWRWRQPFDLEVDAVDLADVAPTWWPTLPAEDRARIRFHGRTQIEALPFETASMDAVLSQYGLEYADLTASTAELRRVARPGARLAWVCHHVDSLPVRLAGVELSHLKSLLADDGLLAVALPLLDCFDRARTPAGRESLMGDREATALRDRFNALQGHLDREAEASECPDVIGDVRLQVQEAIRAAAQGGLAGAQASLQACRRSLEDSQLRLAELRRHALGADDLAAWLQAMGVQAGWQPTVLTERGACMAWAVIARWPDAPFA